MIHPRRWFLPCVLSLASLTACLVSIDESKLNARSGGDDDDDDDQPKRDAGKDGATTTVESDAGSSGGALTDVLVEAAPVEAGVILPTSCQDALNKSASLPTGPTEIDFQKQSLTVFCDQTTRGGGWTMVHRLSAGPGLTGDPLTFYNSPGLSDTILTEITPKKSNVHYTSRILSHWNLDFPVALAMVRVFDAAGNALQDVVFSATGTNFTNWFSPERIVDTTWTDLKKDVSFSDFTLQGSNDIARRFLINRKYATCETDVGWLVVHGTIADPPCKNYELPSDRIRVYFAPGNTGRKWLDGVSDASSMAVFVK